MTGSASHPVRPLGPRPRWAPLGGRCDGAGRKGEKGDRGSSRCRRSRCRRSQCSLGGSASLWTLRQQDAPPSPRLPADAISAQCKPA